MEGVYRKQREKAIALRRRESVRAKRGRGRGKEREEWMGRVWCWLWLGLPNLSCRLDKCSVMRGVCTHGEGGSFWRLRPPVLRSLIQSRRHDVHINHTHWHEVRHTAQPGINSSPTHQKKKEDWACSDHRRPQALLSAEELLNSITPSAPRSDSSPHPTCLSNDL